MKASFAAVGMALGCTPALASEPTPPHAATPSSPVEAPVVRTVDGTGGTVTSADGVLTVVIPPGALDRPVALTFQRTATPGGSVHYRLLPESVPLRHPARLVQDCAGHSAESVGQGEAGQGAPLEHLGLEVFLTCPPVHAARTAKTLGSGGGTLTSPNGRLTLEVPPGALSAPVELRLEEREDPAAPGRIRYRLAPEGLTFAHPARLLYRVPDGEDPRRPALQSEGTPASSVTLLPDGRTQAVEVTHL